MQLGYNSFDIFWKNVHVVDGKATLRQAVNIHKQTNPMEYLPPEVAD